MACPLGKKIISTSSQQGFGLVIAAVTIFNATIVTTAIKVGTVGVRANVDVL